MPTNVFFSPKVATEQFLYEDIIIESIKMYGQDVFYLPRKIMQRDFILGEDTESQFNTANTIEMYIENTEGFEGEGNIFAKFGMEIRDEVTFVVARRSWDRLVGLQNSDINIIRPMEGDLIYLPLSKSFFEISFIEHEAPFYQLSNLPVYKLQARMFEFSDEEFNTGIADVDAIETKFGYQETFEYSVVSGTFTAGERIKCIISPLVSQTGTATASFGSGRGIGRLTSIAVTTAGSGHVSTGVTVLAHTSADKTLEGVLSNATITQSQYKFPDWSVNCSDSAKYHHTDLNNDQTNGTVEFFFKTKAATTYAGTIAQFGDFRVELAGDQVICRENASTVSSATYNNADWNHVKIAVDITAAKVQIFVNGTRLSDNSASGTTNLIGAGGHHVSTKQIQLKGVNSTANTIATNGVYFDNLAVNTTSIAQSTTITVPTGATTLDVINDGFAPIQATATATKNAAGGITAVTLVNSGRFYASLPTVTIATSPKADVAEVNISASVVGAPTGSGSTKTLTIDQIETSDGKYHQFVVTNSIVGATSSATGTISKIYDVATAATDSTFLNDPSARNFNFEDEADDIIDFSENNPFGDAT